MGLTRQQLVTLAILLIGTFLCVLNQTLLSPALAVIMRDLQIDAQTVQYIMSIYSLVEAVVIPLSAYFLGRFSTRQLYIGGLSLFAVGSTLAALAPSFPFILAGRALQAFSAGVFMPMIFTIVVMIIPREHRGIGMGIVGLIIGFAPAIGPSLSGLLVDSIGWRMLFVVTICTSVTLVLCAIKWLKNYGNFERVNFDKPSVVMSTIGLSCLLFGLSSFTSASIIYIPLTFIVIGLIVCTLFVRRQLTYDKPLLKVDILKVPKYRIVVIVGMLAFGVTVGLSTMLPLYIQNVRGYTALQSGLSLMPGAVLGALTGVAAGRLFDRVGVRKCVLPGIFIYITGGLCLNLLNLSIDLYLITGIYILIIVGNQIVFTPMNTWGINSLDNSQIPHANAVSNTLNQVSASFITAFVVSISALGWLVDPTGDAISQTYAGYHLAFIAISIIACCVFLVVFVFVRDKKDKQPQSVDVQVVPDTGMTEEAKK